MDFKVYGTQQTHKVGEFAPRLAFDHYFFGYFHTDYIYELDGRMYPGQAGELLIFPPGKIVYHGGTPGDERGFVNDWMHVGGDDLDELLHKFPIPLCTPIRTDPRYLSGAIERIHRELSFRPVGFSEKCDLIMADMIIDIFRDYRQKCGSPTEERLGYARGEIMSNYMQSWTLEQMARLSGYSASRFAVIYKESYGISPVNDLIRERIKQAELLLRYSSMQISEIATDVGFSSLYYFSRHFKKLIGVCPSEYRARCTEVRDG